MALRSIIPLSDGRQPRIMNSRPYNERAKHRASRGSQLCVHLLRRIAVRVALPRGPVAADQDAEAVGLIIQPVLCQHCRDVVLVRVADAPPAAVRGTRIRVQRCRLDMALYHQLDAGSGLNPAPKMKATIIARNDDRLSRNRRPKEIVEIVGRPTMCVGMPCLSIENPWIGCSAGGTNEA